MFSIHSAVDSSFEHNSIATRHPALPGTYAGLGALQRQYDDFQIGKTAKVGIMIHEVIEGMSGLAKPNFSNLFGLRADMKLEVDLGQTVCVREIPIYKEDTLSDFENRVHENEWYGLSCDEMEFPLTFEHIGSSSLMAQLKV